MGASRWEPKTENFEQKAAEIAKTNFWTGSLRLNQTKLQIQFLFAYSAFVRPRRFYGATSFASFC
jgi:hypothetical protein